MEETTTNLELIWQEYRKFLRQPDSITMCTLISKVVKYHEQWLSITQVNSIPDYVLPEIESLLDYDPSGDKFSDEALELRFSNLENRNKELRDLLALNYQVLECRVKFLETTLLDPIDF